LVLTHDFFFKMKQLFILRKWQESNLLEHGIWSSTGYLSLTCIYG
jgi:hypothetical protein